MNINTFQSPDKKYIAVAVIEKDGKILLAQRTRNDHAFGKWEFPGGKQEEGETLYECLKRELYEELSISAEVGDYVCTSSFYHNDVLYDMVAFKVPVYSGVLTLNEHSAFVWVTIDELNNYAMPEADVPIVEALQRSS